MFKGYIMFLILFENNTYVISENNFIDTSKIIEKSMVHFQIKTACSSPYSFSEIHTLNDEFVDSLFVDLSVDLIAKKMQKDKRKKP